MLCWVCRHLGMEMLSSRGAHLVDPGEQLSRAVGPLHLPTKNSGSFLSLPPLGTADHFQRLSHSGFLKNHV